jgi:hypothetical protein
VNYPLAIVLLLCASFGLTILYAGWCAMRQWRNPRGHPTRSLALRSRRFR